MNDLLSISEAAKALDLAPARVRHLAAHGQLQAAKVGDRWLVERAAVEQRRRRPGPRGRPFGVRNAWALLLMASREEPPPGLDPSVRSRLKRALALEGLEALAPRLANRGRVRYFTAHPGELAYLFEDSSLVRSGISAAGTYELDLVSGQEVDGYLRKQRLAKFEREHALSPAGLSGNVRIRLVADEAWPFGPQRSIAPWAAVALDLADDPDPRSSMAGAELLNAFPDQP